MLVVGEALVIAGLRLLYPRITRRGLLFGVYVGEECWGGEEARRIARSWQSGMVLWSPVSAGLGIAFFLKYRTPLRNVSFAAPKVHSELPAKPAAWSRYACLTGQPARRNAPPGQAARCWASCPFNTVSRPATRAWERPPHAPGNGDISGAFRLDHSPNLRYSSRSQRSDSLSYFPSGISISTQSWLSIFEPRMRWPRAPAQRMAGMCQSYE
ncbi:MAG: hypothetical protein H6Q05_2153 [Acidobacteria bacterium]|nr:hypothetical protein [Acidobacteriota bacterium]